MPTYILGSKLLAHLQQEAKARCAHRYTKEHVPAWARERRTDSTTYPPHFADDADWLANTYFPVTKKGELSNRPSDTRSYPTRPDNPELRRASNPPPLPPALIA